MIHTLSASNGFGNPASSGPDGALSFMPTEISDSTASVNELALLLTAGRMSRSDRSIIAASYGNFLKRQRIPSKTACDCFRTDEASCAFCSRWYDGRPDFRETEDDGACVYVKMSGKKAKCTPMRRVLDTKKNPRLLSCAMVIRRRSGRRRCYWDKRWLCRGHSNCL